MVAVAAGVAVWHILHHSGKHSGFVLLMQFPNRGSWLFRHILLQIVKVCIRLLGLDFIFLCQRLFRLDFVVLRLFLFGEIAVFLDK